MVQGLYRLMIELTNGKFTSKVLKKFATSKVSHFIIPSFVKAYKINLLEMEKSLDEYPTLHDLFVRRLKVGARPNDQHPLSIVSPVDGVLEDIGEIKKTNEITVKGKNYSIAEMLGNEQVLAKYINGLYMILYLSPSHYHRIHSPVTGEIIGQWTLGRKSFPVNKWGLKYGHQTLSKNYRRITEIKHESGHVAVVKVGAMFVNSIEMVHEGGNIGKGEELAYFTFGSTVVLLFEKDTFDALSSIKTPKDISVGQKLGEIRAKQQKK
ncbi:phosphatidylserine decarboxylase [Bacillus sp. 1NLA3E]|uniref:phosphatidylserine decarboxylase n=1 Tax=Bacillus sp. 1NLA3E TaxID=666686 RepID=UPI000247F071|nr:phosphatidylserine decarboxylase [Bacillus sp. 1NLA3E]